MVSLEHKLGRAVWMLSSLLVASQGSTETAHTIRAVLFHHSILEPHLAERSAELFLV
jgi:hypothetical protein